MAEILALLGTAGAAEAAGAGAAGTLGAAGGAPLASAVTGIGAAGAPAAALGVSSWGPAGMTAALSPMQQIAQQALQSAAGAGGTSIGQRLGGKLLGDAPPAIPPIPRHMAGGGTGTAPFPVRTVPQMTGRLGAGPNENMQRLAMLLRRQGRI
jgi:hypothetical protein